MIKTLAIFTELSKPKLLRAEFYLSPLLQEIEEPALIKKGQHCISIISLELQIAMVEVVTLKRSDHC